MRLPILTRRLRNIGIGTLVIVASAGILAAALYATGPQGQSADATGPQGQSADATGPQGQSAEQTTDSPTTISTGSGAQFKTTVDRKTEGELSAEDFRQASLLTSRIVLHLNQAAQHIGDEQNDQARQELEKGVALVEIVRGLLPTTIITTVVRDSTDKEVYRYVDRLQEDRIPLFDGLVAVQTMEPITDAKEDEAMIQGLRLADAELLHTSVMVELDYVEKKLNRALRMHDKEPKKALNQLMLAQSRGLNFVVDKKDDPLVQAQMALQLAERMVEQGREVAANANLQLAKNHLELYGGLLARGKSEHVTKLQKDISRLQDDIGHKDAAASIRGFWDRVASWFTREPGEMQRSSAKKTKSETEKKEDNPKTQKK